MSSAAFRWNGNAADESDPSSDAPLGVLGELDGLRRENRRLAISLGAFSAFMASKGLLEEAWVYVNEVHQLEEEAGGG